MYSSSVPSGFAFLFILSVLLSSPTFVFPHAALVKISGAGDSITLPGLSVKSQTPDPSQAIQVNNDNPCGKEIGKDLQSSVEDAVKDGVPRAGDDGSVGMTLFQINADGSGPYQCFLSTSTNSSSITQNKNFRTQMEITTQVGNQSKKGMKLVAKMPEGTKCDGPKGSCVVQCRNKANFGGCVAVAPPSQNQNTIKNQQKTNPPSKSKSNQIPIADSTTRVGISVVDSNSNPDPILPPLAVGIKRSILSSRLRSPVSRNTRSRVRGREQRQPKQYNKRLSHDHKNDQSDGSILSGEVDRSTEDGERLLMIHQQDASMEEKRDKKRLHLLQETEKLEEVNSGGSPNDDDDDNSRRTKSKKTSSTTTTKDSATQAALRRMAKLRNSKRSKKGAGERNVSS